MSFEIETFAPPLKRELPLLEYDIALYCSEFCKWTEGVWPEYLVDFKEKVLSYSRQLKRLKPQITDISPDIRIYILDHRLSLLFAALDNSGEMATFITKFCAQYERHDIEACYYGDGGKIADELPCKMNGELCFAPDFKELARFNRMYGFVPSEMFACPAVLIFQDEDLAAVYQTTMKHCVLIMDKFHDKNLVDLKSIISQVELCDPLMF